MNKNDLIKKLENLDLPEVELPRHQRRLKMALLNSGYFKEKTTMFTFKKFIPVGAIALVAIVAVVEVVSLTGKPSQVSAQEIVNNSYLTITNMSYDQQKALDRIIGSDSLSILQEAQNAPDLRTLTYDEYVKDSINIIYGSDGPHGNPKNLRFIRYTSKAGSTVTIGIEPKTNLPAFIIDIFQSQSQEFQDANYQQTDGKAIAPGN